MSSPPTRTGGFTLVELLVALSTASTLALLSWPSMQSQMVKARRADATAALTRLQAAQEGHRGAHGLYASELSALGQAQISAEGLYDIELQSTGADGYQALARARAGGPQAGDGLCGEITLRVSQGFADNGPSQRCWQR